MADHAHLVYIVGVVVLLVVMALRKNVIVPAVIATVLTAWAFTGNAFQGLAAPFNGLIVATTQLLDIFLVLAVISAMTGAMRVMKTDTLMVQPLVRFMRNGHLAFVVLFVASYLMSLVFWPTPTLAILAAVLIPAAVAAGLTRLGAAIAVAVSGQGMALGSDYIMGVAPGIAASGGDLDASLIADRALILSWVVGAVAVTVAFVLTSRGRLVVPVRQRTISSNDEIADVVSQAMTSRRSATATAGGGTGTAEVEVADPEPRSGKPGSEETRSGEPELVSIAGDRDEDLPVRPTTARQRRAVAIGVPLIFLTMVVLLFLSRFTGLFTELEELSGAALIGGIGLGVLFLVCFFSSPDPLEAVAEHVVDGFVFAFKTMGVVIPVAGFVLMGVGDFSGTIMSLGDDASGPAFLFDVIESGQDHVPSFAVATCLALMVAGMLVGLDGSGWAGLPLIGSLAAALGPAAGVDAETLAAIGQNAASWTGGGTLVVWSSLVAVAGVTGISVVELARRLFIPVVSGLVVAALLASVIY